VEFGNREAFCNIARLYRGQHKGPHGPREDVEEVTSGTDNVLDVNLSSMFVFEP